MSHPTTSAEPQRVGPYRLDAWLGAGGMGTVWRAWDERLHRPVAVKHIRAHAIEDPVSRERFRREARATARLNNSSIVHIYDILETDEGEFIVMELVEGENLARLIDEEAPFPAERAVQIAWSIARGLAEAHAKEIVHRDLKAENVMVTGEGEAKILDFGLAKPMSPDLLDATLTSDGEVVGTAQAMSPEQVMGLTVDPRSDLFSLGILLYEMLTGTTPFRGDTLFMTLDRVCRHEPPPVVEVRPDVPVALSELVERLLAKEPAERPRNAREIIATLMGLAEEPFDPSSRGVVLAENRSAPSPGSAAPLTASRRPPTAIERRREATSPAASDVHPGERRQVTVICCDLLGAGSPGSESFHALDPEILFELMPEFQAVAETTIERYEGSLGNLLGHRLWAYFGYPRAHEDSAVRAVRAALELGEHLAELESTAAASGVRKLALRTAIHTGPAVVMAAPGGQLALGPTLDLSTALHGLAEPRQIWVSETTRRLVADTVTLEALAPARPTGSEHEVAVYRVLGLKEPSEPGLDEALVPLVARDAELAELTRIWRHARAGMGQVVLLEGDAGIGKSRLVRAVETRLGAEAGEWCSAYATPYTQHSPLYPMAELLHRLLGARRQDSTTVRLERLESMLDDHGFSRAEFVPLFAALLSLPLGERYEPLAASPQKLRVRTMEALSSLLLERAERHPMVLVVEDLQWLDPSTLDLLDILVHQVAAVSMLVILTFRTGFEVPWTSFEPAGLVRLRLEPLDARQARQLVEKVAEGHDLPPAVLKEIVAHTDGVPLFAEEITKAVLEAELWDQQHRGSDESRPALRIPATLQDSLTARLDRLGPAKTLAQEAAVIGREFTYDILAAVSSVSAGRVRRGVDRLVDSGLVNNLKGWRLRYLFQHALVRDAAYESLLSKRRRELHLRVADVLEKHSPARVAEQPEILAYHFTEAGLAEKAARYWLDAGRLALDRSALREGITHLERGLEVLESLDASRERDRLELALLSRLGPAASVAYGYGAPEVERVYERASTLSEGLTTAPQLFWIVWGLWAFHLVRCDLERALELGDRLTIIADGEDVASENHQVFRVVAASSVALAHYFRGDLALARNRLVKAVAYDPAGRTAPLPSATGQDTGVVVRALLALVLWHLGLPEEAVEMSDEAVALAERIQHPYSQAYARVWAARLHQSNRDAQRTREHAEAVIVLSEEHGFFWLSQGYFFRGCSLAERRRQEGKKQPVQSVDRAAHLQRRGLEAYRAGGALLSQTYMLAQMVESAIDTGQTETARELLDEALTVCTEGGERFWEAELRRLRGELELAGDPRDAKGAAEHEFGAALGIARRREDRAFELRAALSLARLRRSQERHDDSREAVEAICRAYGDEITSADLDEARTFLETRA